MESKDLVTLFLAVLAASITSWITNIVILKSRVDKLEERVAHQKERQDFMEAAKIEEHIAGIESKIEIIMEQLKHLIRK